MESVIIPKSGMEGSVMEWKEEGAGINPEVECKAMEWNEEWAGINILPPTAPSAPTVHGMEWNGRWNGMG